MKKKAQQVVEKFYDKSGLSLSQRSALANWLLQTHPTRVKDGIRNVPNFIFGGLNIVFDKSNNIDVKVSKNIY